MIKTLLRARSEVVSFKAEGDIIAPIGGSDSIITRCVTKDGKYAPYQLQGY